jgi:hypothetical protein
MVEPSSSPCPLWLEIPIVFDLRDHPGRVPHPKTYPLVIEAIVGLKRCKENGPRAIWLIEFWCLMINTTCELISFLVFVFVVHRMRRELDQGNEDATPQKKT